MTDLHSSQKSQGVEYCDLVRTYQVTFCSYTIFPNRPEFVCRVALRTPEGELFSDQLNAVLIELSKLNDAQKKSVSEMTPLEMWSLYLKYVPEPKLKDLVDKIINQKEEIRMANALLMEISRDEDERAKFRSRRKFETDMQSNLIASERIGERRGISKLLELLRKGVSVDDAEKMLVGSN